MAYLESEEKVKFQKKKIQYTREKKLTLTQLESLFNNLNMLLKYANALHVI